MHKLHSLFDRLCFNYKKYRMAGLLQFISWLLRLSLEKLLIGLQARFHFHRFVSFYLPLNGSRGIKNDRLINKPVITFIIPNATDMQRVRITIRSLQRQSNPNWECYLFNGELPGKTVLPDNYRIIDLRIKHLDLPAMENESDLLKAILPHVKGRWILMTRLGDRQLPDLVATLATYRADIVYWDEARYHGCIVYDPFYKPDWSPELWLSVDILRCSAVDTGFLRKRADSKVGGSLMAGLIKDAKLILHIPKLLTHCSLPAWEDPTTLKNHLKSVDQYLRDMGIRQPVVINENKNVRISWELKPDLVSIIIPSKNNALLLESCVNSIFERTIYNNFEIIIVDNQSTDVKTLEYYSQLRRNNNVRIIQIGDQFNYSHACNMGAKAARGKYFLFLNNDIEVITPSWVKNLVAICGLTGVGVVGGKLLYPNGKIQHAGIVLGLEGHASHVFHGNQPDRHSPFGSVDWYRNYSAVTGACMLVRKDVFSELKGFDEKFVLIFNDVDLCLRAWKKGYRTVYNPEVVLLHHEGSTREKYNPSSDVLLGYERFQKCIEAGDPYYNPNLSLAVRIPTTKKKWEGDPLSRIEKIIKFDWY